MVASSLRAASSVEERRYLFHLLAQLVPMEEGEGAGADNKVALAARLLDFDPKLVIPQQQKELQAARAEQAELERMESVAAAAAAAGNVGKEQAQLQQGAGVEPAQGKEGPSGGGAA
jgi:hypothetical protein